MPCNSDYQNPSTYDVDISQTVKNLIFVLNELGIQTNNELAAAYRQCFFSKEEGDKWTAELCSRLSSLSKKDKNRIIYNAKSAKSRRLADWYEEHQEADKKREAKEMQDLKDSIDRATALNKLTKREKTLLGI